MTHCETCPRSGIKDIYDNLEPDRQRQVQYQFEGACENCPLANGCPSIFSNALNRSAEEWGDARRYTNEELQQLEGRISNFDNEY